MSKLYNIKDCVQDLEEVVDMIYSQWGKFFRKTKEEKITEIKNAVANNLSFPIVYVMKEENEIIGTFTIKEMLVDEKEVTSVWYLMIKKEFRGKGYGRKLLEHLNDVCKEYNQIYLVTEHVDFYEKIGFKFIKEVEHNGQTDRLYFKQLSN